jgi:hypothetical protein
MSAIVRLEWEIDSKGYDIEDRAGSGKVRKGISTDLTDPERTILGTPAAGLFVIARGGKPERYVLEGIENRVFEDLANTPETPEGVLAFVNKWGLPFRTKDMSLSLLDPPHGMVNGEFYNCIWQLKRAVEFASSGNFEPFERSMDKRGIAGLQVRFGRMRGDSAPRLFVEPRSLNTFCWLELMQSIVGGAHFQRCLNCGAFFSIGIERGTRSTRQYCSDRCRVAMHRKGRGKS